MDQTSAAIIRTWLVNSGRFVFTSTSSLTTLVRSSMLRTPVRALSKAGLVSCFGSSVNALIRPREAGVLRDREKNMSWQTTLRACQDDQRIRGQMNIKGVDYQLELH